MTGSMTDDGDGDGEGRGDGGGDGGKRTPQAPEPVHVPEPEPLGELLDLVDEAVVTCDPSGSTVRGFNRAAARLFPRLRPGTALSTSPTGPLADAAASGAERFEAEYGGRALGGDRRMTGGRTVWLVREAGAARKADEALVRERDRSAFLEETARRLGNSLHHGRTVRTLVRIALPRLADAAVAVLPGSGRLTVWDRAGPGDDRCSGQVPVEALEQVPQVADALHGLRPRPAVVGPGEMALLGRLIPDEFVHGGDALVLQLTGGGVPTGAMILLRGPRRARFDEWDIDLARRFATRAGLALATAALYSQQAHTIAVLQARMAPEPLPVVDGVGVGAAYRPAAEALHISGDFYHVAARPEGGVAFFFGDVVGKGAEAAVLAVDVRQSMRTLARVTSAHDPVRDLELLNDVVIDDGHRFTTLVTGSARPDEDGSVRVEIADGGHLPPLVLRGDGSVDEIACDGMIVGGVRDPRFSRTEFRLGPGELMLLYSDGITEARGGVSGNEMYGDERLAGALATCGGMQAAAVAERLELLTTQWLGGRPHDDISVLTLQAPPRPGVPPVRRSESR